MITAANTNVAVSANGDRQPHTKVALLRGSSPYLKAIRGTAVAAFVECQIVQPPAQMLTVMEELALVRESATRAVRIYAACREAEIKDPDNTKLNAMTDQASVIMKQCLFEVADLCERGARIAATVNRTFSWGYINQIVTVMLRAINDVVGDQPELMQQINDRMAQDFEQLKALTSEDQEIADSIDAMDATVPV